MPPKKRGGNDASTPDTPTTQSSAPIKRQRVSLACDACRVARERCDGGRPTCGTCVSQKRACSYTPAAKKRGVQTGYLRTVELSLAWLCENFPDGEEALHQLLKGNDAAKLLSKDKSGNQLHKKWSKSKIHREIGRLLSDGSGMPGDNNSAEDSDTDGDTTADPQLPLPTEKRMVNTCLPGNWRRLVEIYFTYTHSWLPIISKDAIIATAQAFPAQGIPLNSTNDFPSAYAELWAVLALAAFQDSASQLRSAGEPRLSPQRIYFIARNMMPSEERRFELPHLRALLLHSMVLIGQGAALAAWMLVGTAVRLALHLRGTGELYARDGTDEPLRSPGALAFTACLILNTFTSACLGQPTFLKVDISDIHAFIDVMGRAVETETWHGIPGMGPSGNDGALTTIQPLKTFYQLYKFTQVLSISLDAESRREQNQATEDVTTEDLVKCLDPQFAFCSSVLYGGSTPLVPSAFVLQAAFLAITIHLVSGYRASLVSSLVEVVESCVSQFGTCGTPPVVVGLLGMVHRCGHIERLHDGERERWNATIESLRNIWRRQVTGTSPAGHAMDASYVPPAAYGSHQADPGMGVTSPDFLGLDFDNSQSLMGSNPSDSGFLFPENEDAMPPQQRHTEAFQPFATHLPTRGPSMNNSGVRNTSSSTSRIPWVPSSGLMAGPATSRSHGGLVGSTPQPVDYDAILEELGSIDCTDGLDMDPQFMTNLGFAPGADLGEMFQADFGA